MDCNNGFSPLKSNQAHALRNLSSQEDVPYLAGFIAIGKDLILSPPFPLLYTVRETFASYGVPSYICKLFIV